MKEHVRPASSLPAWPMSPCHQLPKVPGSKAVEDSGVHPPQATKWHKQFAGKDGSLAPNHVHLLAWRDPVAFSQQLTAKRQLVPETVTAAVNIHHLSNSFCACNMPRLVRLDVPGAEIGVATEGFSKPKNPGSEFHTQFMPRVFTHIHMSYTRNIHV